MSQTVNAWQDLLNDLCFVRESVNPKAVARQLGMARNYCSDICRRERVDPFAVFNAILRLAEPPRGQTPTPAVVEQIISPILDLLVHNTHWCFLHLTVDKLDAAADYGRLIDSTGSLLEVLGGAVRSLVRIEADDRIDASDDAQIASFRVQANSLIDHLKQLLVEVERRRLAGVTP